ncbi:ABC transporter permease [Pullulanibacillus camelliae]|uniref:Glutathione transport system permease protein GsiD n=2 Tax=Pullulanibacillus camelliae TaxID=1707096 RepID=A0A8J2YDY8_9BACL|nr:ABC transporter permease [Pullulanibacillus camelliae]
MSETMTVSKQQIASKRGTLSTFWHDFRQRKVAFISFLFFVLLVILAVIGPYIVPFNPQTPDYNHVLQGMSQKHWAGTDEYGRDVLSRLIAGTRISLGIGISSVLIGAMAGTILGLVSGYFGKWVDKTIMRICDVLFAFPDILLAIGIVAILGPGLKNVIFAVAFFSVPSFARMVRGKTLEVKEMLFIEAEKSIGAKTNRIIFRHIFPETIPIIIVYLTMQVGTAILAAASLSFLGLGASPSSPDWGAMLSMSRDYIGTAFNLVFFPGLAIFLTVLSLNNLGDGLRDILDPKIKD